MKKTSVISFLLVIALATAGLFGCGSGKDVEWENQKKALVEKYLSAAPGLSYGAVAVDSTTKGLTVDNIKSSMDITLADGTPLMTVAWAAEKFAATGVNFVDDPKGVMDLAEKAVLTNMTYTVQYSKEFFAMLDVPNSTTPPPATGSAQEVVFEKVRDDAEAFIKGLGMQKLALNELAILSKFHAASVSAKNIASVTELDPALAQMGVFGQGKSVNGTAPTMKVTVSDWSVKDFSYEQWGEYLLKNYVAEVNNEKLFTLESAGVKKVAIPGLFAKLAMPDPLPELLKQDFTMEGMTANNLKIFTSAGVVEIKGMDGYLTKTSDKLAFRQGMKDLIIPAAMLDAGTSLAGVGKFSDLHDKPLTLSGEMEMIGTLQGDKVLIDVPAISLNDANLGGFKMEMAMEGTGVTLNVNSTPPFHAQAWLLKKAKTTLEDKGLLDLSFAGAAMAQQGVPAAQAREAGKVMRAQVAVMFPSLCVATAGPGLQGLCNDLGKLIGAPGTFEATIAPAEPILMDPRSIELAKDPAKAGLTWKYTAK